MLGYCGLDCESCPIFVATVNNDEQLRQETLEDWSKLYSDYLGKACLTLKDMNCKGCRQEDNIFVGCLNCQIRRCCGERKFVTCADCENFETCDVLNGFYSVPLHRSAKDNLDRIGVR